jgi:hypothetical protein
MQDAMVSTRPGRNKVRTRHSAALRACLVAAGAFLLAAVACGTDAASPRGVAERFLDAHYVQIDLRAALGVTAGVARRKIESEIGLTAGQEIDASTRAPHVRYRLLEERGGEDGAQTYLYEGRITVEDADTFSRRWLVTVRRVDPESWRVTNFQEFGE